MADSDNARSDSISGVESRYEARPCFVAGGDRGTHVRPDAAAQTRSQIHAVYVAQRTDGDSPRGSQRPDGLDEHVVSRRLGAREARTHRLRAPVRAPDVQG